MASWKVVQLTWDTRKWYVHKIVNSARGDGWPCLTFVRRNFRKRKKKQREAWFGWYLVSNDKLGYKIHILPKWFFKLNFFFSKWMLRNVGTNETNEPDQFTFSSIILKSSSSHDTAADICYSLSIVMTSIIFWEWSEASIPKCSNHLPNSW